MSTTRKIAAPLVLFAMLVAALALVLAGNSGSAGAAAAPSGEPSGSYPPGTPTPSDTGVPSSSGASSTSAVPSLSFDPTSTSRPPGGGGSSSGNSGSGGGGASGPSVALSDTSPAAGQTVTATGHGFAAGENISFELFSAVVHVGSANADSSGTVSLSFAIPESFSGNHELALTGTSSGRVASIGFTVGAGAGAAAGQRGGGSSGPLSATGVAVLGIGGLGLLLLAGGIVLLVASRRQRPLVGGPRH